MTTVDSLTPEQRTARNQFEYFYNNSMPECIATPFPKGFQFDTGYVGFSDKNLLLRRLPHGENWTWNQSNGKLRMNLENDRYVVFQKMSARGKPGTPKPPFCKLWVYKIYDRVTNKLLGTLLWCEKGATSSDYIVTNVNIVPKTEKIEQTVLPVPTKMDLFGEVESYPMFSEDDIEFLNLFTTDVYSDFINPFALQV